MTAGMVPVSCDATSCYACTCMWQLATLIMGVMTCRQVPKMLGLLGQQWAPEAFVISFKLETDESLLIAKVTLLCNCLLPGALQPN